jgi:hypothetical protein
LLPNTDPRTTLEQLVKPETTEFGLSNAFLSRIDIENETEHFEIVHGSHEMLTPGTSVPLSKTYCRKTIADPEGTLAVSDALAEGWGDDPAYETFELGSYLGTTVSVAEELYGTLCFANSAARDEPIRDKEKALVEMFGQWVEFTMALSDEPPIRETSLDTIEERAVSSEAIDLMMDALRKRTRRIILMSLVGNTTEISLATLEQRIHDENTPIPLIHTHLPKLANAGYIKWDSESETVSKEPRFSEVEPLVQLLREYNTTFSE